MTRNRGWNRFGTAPEPVRNRGRTTARPDQTRYLSLTVVCRGVCGYEIHPSNGDLGAPSWMENQPLACPHCGHPDDDHESLFLGGKCFYCDDCEGWA